MGFAEEIVKRKALIIEQKYELAEFVGIETRNKYAVAGEDGAALGYAAEQQKGWSGFLLSQFLGHWRTFDVSLYDVARTPVLVAHHPFRWFFQRFDVSTADGQHIGALRLRFSLLSKRIDVEDAAGSVRMTVSSPLWRLWTFPFKRGNRTVAVVSKKWGGLLAESFSDKDRFRVEYQDSRMGPAERLLVLAAALFIDIKYFENRPD